MTLTLIFETPTDEISMRGIRRVHRCKWHINRFYTLLCLYVGILVCYL